MKKILAITLTLLASMTVSAQKTVENSFLSINVPQGWEVYKLDLPGVGCEAVGFNNTGTHLNNIGMVNGYDNKMDPVMFITNQLNICVNIDRTDATVGEIHPATFLGKDVYAADFQNKVKGNMYKGTIYAFNEGDATIMCFGAYTPGRKSRLPEIWKSIKWKNRVAKKSKFKNLEEETASYTKSLDSLLKKEPCIADGEQFLGISFVEESRCVVYENKALDFDGNSIPEENKPAFVASVKEKLVQVQKETVKNSSLFAKWVNAGYKFRYLYYDMNGKLLCDITIHSEELQ